MTKKEQKDISLLDVIIDAIHEKKAEEVVSLDLSKLNECITDSFVICHGNSNTQVNAIAASVRDEVKKELGIIPIYMEGMSNAEWIILDYGDIVVHVFQREIREYYRLEDLWHDARLKKHYELDEVKK